MKPCYEKEIYFTIRFLQSSRFNCRGLLPWWSCCGAVRPNKERKADSTKQSLRRRTGCSRYADAGRLAVDGTGYSKQRFAKSPLRCSKPRDRREAADALSASRNSKPDQSIRLPTVGDVGEGNHTPHADYACAAADFRWHELKPEWLSLFAACHRLRCRPDSLCSVGQ